MFFTLLLMIIPILVFWDYSYRKKLNDKAHRVPGPQAYPIIGNIFLLMHRTAEDSIRSMVGSLDQYSGLVRLWVFNQMTFLVSDPRILEVVLTSPKYIKKNSVYDFLHDWLGEGLLVSNGRKWFQRRKIITPTFHFKILEDFVEIFEEQSAVLVERLKKHSDKGAFNINPYITMSALDVISETSLGTKINAQTNPDCEYARAVHDMTDITMERIVKPYLKFDITFKIIAPKLKRKQDSALKVLHDFTENIIEERKKQLLKITPNESTEQDDLGRKKKMALLDVLLQSTVDGMPLSNTDIREEVDTFTFEGHDTTTGGISFALYCLSRNAEAQNKVFAEIREVIGVDTSKAVSIKELNDLKYLEFVLKESMRLYPPVPIIGRKLEEDLQIDDIILPAGSDITIPIFYILKNPNVFPEPEQFRPERFLENSMEKGNPYAYIPFSAGPRNCIGQKFAMLEMKSTVSKVIRHFELLPLGESADATVNLVTRSKNGINLGLRPRVYAAK